MLIDLLSHSNYNSYNIFLARMIGLESAIYMNILLDITEKAKKKSTSVDNYFVLDRNYVTERTTFTLNKQLEIESNLLDRDLISLNDKKSIKVNTDTLYSMFNVSDNELSKLNNSNFTKSTKRTKRECVRDNLKSAIVCTNTELREAYDGWIDGVYANPKGFLSKRAITIAQEVVDKFCNHDLDLAITIINIAAVNGYRDMEWAINKYNAESKSNYKLTTKHNEAVKLSNEVF